MSNRANPLPLAAGARLSRLVAQPAIYPVLLEHAYRGLRTQLVLRSALVVFVVLAVALVPPQRHSGVCYVIASVYGAWSVGVTAVMIRGGELAVRLIWLALFADLAALAILTMIAGVSVESWTDDLLINGFFLIPLLSATQLRPWVCTVVAAPTVALYLASSIVTQDANGEPWASVLLRTVVLAGVAVGCVLLSYVQRSRVVTIGELVSERTALLADALTIQDRERRELAETLHDGALQYVLAARMDLEDARDRGDVESFDRIDQALRESAGLLRSTMTELHPAVLEQAGLAHAVRELARTAQVRGGFDIKLSTDEWPEALRTSGDALLFASARELLTNVVKHAHAGLVVVELCYRDGIALLRIADDGQGIAEGLVEQRLSEGHIGLAARRVRIEAAGGQLRLTPAEPTGTIAEVQLPVGAIPASL